MGDCGRSFVISLAVKLPTKYNFDLFDFCRDGVINAHSDEAQGVRASRLIWMYWHSP